MVKAVLLDVDGTLVLSNDAHAIAWVEAFMHFGFRVDYDRVRSMIGMGGDKIMPLLVPDLKDAPEIAGNISEKRSQIFMEKHASALKPAPASRELVKHLKARGLKVLVASSAKKEELGVLLQAAGVDDLLDQDQATTSGDAEESKPAPDIIHAALAKLGLSGPKVMMVGDTPYDIESATGAGVPIIAVRCGGWNDKDLKGALAIYDNPADLLARHNFS